MIDFVTEHKDLRVADGLRWGVEPLCQVLTGHDIKISASTYYEWVTKMPSKQQLRDEAVVELCRVAAFQMDGPCRWCTLKSADGGQ